MRWLLIPTTALVLALAAAACSGSDDDSNNGANASPSPSPTATIGATPTLSPAGDALSTVELVQLLSPAVVHVQTGFGSGTGFIIDQDGYIVTNNHVIEGAAERGSEIRATLSNGRQFTADLVGRDEFTDIAVLRINASDLTPANLGASSDLLVGEEVVAIGHALGLAGGPSVTKGVVSAMRLIQEGNITIPEAIQTDAAINPGNSGGPLVNMMGQVIGINTAVIRASSSFVPTEGIGLAISIDSARPVIDDIVRTGRVNRGFLDVAIAPVEVALEAGCGTPGTSTGVLLLTVTPGGPADMAGLATCDVIIQVADIEIENTISLFQALTEYPAGESVEVEFVRGNSRQSTQVTLAERPQ